MSVFNIGSKRITANSQISLTDKGENAAINLKVSGASFQILAILAKKSGYDHRAVSIREVIRALESDDNEDIKKRVEQLQRAGYIRVQ